MSHRALALFTFVILFFAGCGGDTPSGPELQPGIISGNISTTDGRGGIDGALLKVLAKDSVNQQTFSNKDGNFRFNRVDPGQYKVEATLPEGFKKSVSLQKNIQVDGGVSIDFKGEPITEQTKTILKGEKDTLFTGSGAFIAVDASNTPSDIDITIKEMKDDELAKDVVTKPVQIWIRPPGTAKSASSSAKSMTRTDVNSATSAEVSLGQKVSNNNLFSDGAEYFFDVDTEKEPLRLYAKADAKTYIDPATKRETGYYGHSFKSPQNTNIQITLGLAHYWDKTCSDELRTLDPLPSDTTGDQALILIHGLQPFNGHCKDFEGFDPVEESFKTLIKKLRSNSNIDSHYKFYTYKYPTNAHIIPDANELWKRIQENDIKHPVLLAHSMGGLVGRVLIQNHGNSTVRGLITLGTPHEGTPMTELALNTRGIINSIAFAINPVGTLLNGEFLPDTPGLHDLSLNSDLIMDLRSVKGDPQKIFTMGGDLGNLSAISDFANSNPLTQLLYQVGFDFMKSLGYKNDGMVPLSSALPDWSTQIAILKDHDHTEMVRGENYNEIKDGSITKQLIPLLLQLMPSSPNRGYIYASSAETGNYGSSDPSNLYAVEISPEGQDYSIGQIKTKQGEEPVITDIAKGESGKIWGASYEKLYQIDEKTAVAQRIGDTDYNRLNALEIDSNGNLIAMTINGNIIQLNKESGHGELISELQDKWESAGDLAFGPNDVLYGIVEKDSGQDYLATIDIKSGKVTLVNTESEIGFNNVFGLTFFNNTLYGLTTTINPDGGYLLEIDSTTGIGSMIRPLNFQATGAGKANLKK